MAQFGRYSTDDPLKNLPNTALNFIESQRRKKEGEKKLDLAERGMKLSEGQLKFAQKKEKTKQEQIEPYKKPFSPAEIMKIDAVGGVIDKQLGVKLSGKITPIANTIKNYTEQGYRKIDVYRALKKDWGKHAEPALESLKKFTIEAMANNDVKAVAKYGELYNDLADPDFIDKFMPACARYESDQQKKPEAKEKWTTKTLSSGARIQTEETTKKERVVLGRKPEGKKRGSGKMSPKEKRLKTLRENYFKQIAAARSAAKNIDPLMGDIEVDVKAVREDAKKKAKILAEEYVKEGGKLEDLGLEKEKSKKTKEYKTAEDVRTDFKAGKISEKEAEKILQKKFGYK